MVILSTYGWNWSACTVFFGILIFIEKTSTTIQNIKSFPSKYSEPFRQHQLWPFTTFSLELHLGYQSKTGCFKIVSRKTIIHVPHLKINCPKLLESFCCFAEVSKNVYITQNSRRFDDPCPIEASLSYSFLNFLDWLWQICSEKVISILISYNTEAKKNFGTHFDRSVEIKDKQ